MQDVLALRLPRGLVIRGEVEAPGALVIEGRVEGKVRAAGELTIDASGSVDAEVEADRVVILGRAAGRVEARSRLELHPGARVEATLVAPVLRVAEGAELKGRVEMRVEAPEGLA